MQIFSDYSIIIVNMVYDTKRHTEQHPTEKEFELADWRLKDRLKTVSVAIVLCLNIGIDPPDVFKPGTPSTSQSYQNYYFSFLLPFI